MNRGSMPEARFDAYVICTSPRSGSTLLCALLAATGRSGVPDSHFHDPSVASWAKEYGLTASDTAPDLATLRAIFAAARKRGTGKTGMFGLRLQRRSFDFFLQQVTLLHPGLTDDAALIQAEFGRTLFIYLTRPNKLEQAISFVKATQTGLWHRAPDGTEIERLSAPQDPVYDPVAISGQLADLTAQDAEWRGWFDQQNIQPFTISYNDLAHDPLAVLAAVLHELGLDATLAQGIGPPVAKLADATSRVWADRFGAEPGGH